MLSAYNFRSSLEYGGSRVCATQKNPTVSSCFKQRDEANKENLGKRN